MTLLHCDCLLSLHITLLHCVRFLSLQDSPHAATCEAQGLQKGSLFFEACVYDCMATKDTTVVVPASSETALDAVKEVEAVTANNRDFMSECTWCQLCILGQILGA